MIVAKISFVLLMFAGMAFSEDTLPQGKSAGDAAAKVDEQYPPRADNGVLQRATPLVNAHAHNDYQHKRPLFDALDHGFCSVEADIFLVEGRLLVGHTRFDLRPERTLQALYLDPLRARIEKNGGRVYAGGPTVTLLIDFKTKGPETYAVLRKVLAEYAGMLTVVEKGKVTEKAITAVLSGNAAQARAEILADSPQYAGIDGRPSDLSSDVPASLLPLVSESWGSQFKWRGEGPLPDGEKSKLLEMVKKAHEQGRRVRFWGTPDKADFWKVLREAGVDLLNADDLDGLQKFLLEQHPSDTDEKKTACSGSGEL